MPGNHPAVRRQVQHVLALAVDHGTAGHDGDPSALLDSVDGGIEVGGKRALALGGESADDGALIGAEQRRLHALGLPGQLIATHSDEFFT